MQSIQAMEVSPQLLAQESTDANTSSNNMSTSASATLAQLPGIAALAASTAVLKSPQLRATVAPQNPLNIGVSPAATSGGGGNTLPTCQNCTTSTTPLWRRDEFGSVLCNACGLFLKLHGRPRPISLKTDVIKSRNRVKTMRPDLVPKKQQQQQQHQQQQNAIAAAQAIQRTAQNTSNGDQGGSNSPLGRATTPSMYNQGLPSFMVDDPYQSAFNGSAAAEGTSSLSLNGDRSLDDIDTHEQLIAHNSSLKTRVSELEVINELFRGRLSQLEQQEAAARRGQELAGAEQSHLRTQLEAVQESERHLQAQLEDSHRRENNLKRRLDELEEELRAAQEESRSERPNKKARADMKDISAVTEGKEESELAAEPEPEAVTTSFSSAATVSAS